MNLLLKYFCCCCSFLLIATFSWAQRDTATIALDSMTPVIPAEARLQVLLQSNKSLHLQGTPVARMSNIKKHDNKTSLFYILLGLVFIFAILRRVYAKYFPNLFKVFFNTSLKQSQLTDQLQQEELPSLFANLLFVITAGTYAYLAIEKTPSRMADVQYGQLFLLIAAVATIYFVKFLVLKFTGWVTGYREQARLYVFIVFLVNKLLGIFLLPIIFITAFAQPAVARAFTTVGLIVIGLFLLVRFFRSFTLLQPQIKVSKFHFFLYVFAVEILPIAILYKSLNLFYGSFS